jgi:hypothetical protein
MIVLATSTGLMATDFFGAGFGFSWPPDASLTNWRNRTAPLTALPASTSASRD